MLSVNTGGDAGVLLYRIQEWSAPYAALVHISECIFMVWFFLDISGENCFTIYKLLSSTQNDGNFQITISLPGGRGSAGAICTCQVHTHLQPRLAHCSASSRRPITFIHITIRPIVSILRHNPLQTSLPSVEGTRTSEPTKWTHRPPTN
jgi:hypothetical protein